MPLFDRLPTRITFLNIKIQRIWLHSLQYAIASKIQKMQTTRFNKVKNYTEQLKSQETVEAYFSHKKEPTTSLHFELLSQQFEIIAQNFNL